MDEPLSNLDAKLRVSTRAEIKHLQHTLKVTTIYVTHDQIEAMTLAHRVAIMDKGRVMQIGTPKDIYDRPANLFVAAFIGSPPMNLVKGDLVDGVFRAPGVSLPLGGGSRQGLVLGVRAEDLTVGAADGAQAAGAIYANELLGDSTLVTLRLGESTITARAAKDHRGEIGEAVGFTAPPGAYALFDAGTGRRVENSCAETSQTHDKP
jgi:multiple sugar transport system ATP-binding protein